MEQKSESPHTKTGTRAISNGWVVTDNGVEIATITMSVTTLHGFQEKHIVKLLTSMALGFRSFYLEAGNALKTEP